MSVSGMWFLSTVWMLSLNLSSHPSICPETVQSVEQNFIVFNKDIAPQRRARLSLALIYTNLTLDAPCLLVFCNLPTPRPGPLGQERLPALLIWAQIAPKCGSPAGSWSWVTQAGSLQRHWDVSVPCSSGSSFSLLWDISADRHHLPPSHEHKDESWLRRSAHPRISKCALMPRGGIAGQSWLDSALAKMEATINCESSFISMMSLASFAFHTPYISDFKGG